MPNWIWALIVLLLLAGMTFFTTRLNKRATFVSALHNGIWGGAIALLGTNLIAYDTAGTSAWFTLILGLVGFNAGVWASSLLAPATPQTTNRENQPVALHLVSRRTLLVVSFVYAAAFTYYLVAIQLRFGIAAIIFDPVSIRASRDPSYLEALPLAVRILLYLGPLLFAIYGFKPAVERPLPIWLRIFGLSILTLSMLAMLQRTNFFMGLLLLVTLLLTQPGLLSPGRFSRWKESTASSRVSSRLGRYSPKIRLVASVLVVGLAAFGAFQIVGGALQKTGVQASSTGAVSPVLETLGLVSPYGYYTSGVAAFLQLASSTNEEYPPGDSDGLRLVGDYNPQTWGAGTFAPIVRFIPGVGQLPANSAFIETPVLTNVFTWLEDFYRDFRGAGVFVGTLVVGFVVSALYVRRDYSARAFWLQGVLISPIFLATFAPKYGSTLLLSELLFVVVLGLFTHKIRLDSLKSRRQAKNTQAAQ